MASTFIVTEIPDRPGRSRVVAEADSLGELYALVGAMRIAERRALRSEPEPESPTILAFRRGLDLAARAAGLEPIPEPEVIDVRPQWSE